MSSVLIKDKKKQLCNMRKVKGINLRYLRDCG